METYCFQPQTDCLKTKTYYTDGLKESHSFYSQNWSTNEALDHNWGRGVPKVEEVQIRNYAVQFYPMKFLALVAKMTFPQSLNQNESDTESG